MTSMVEYFEVDDNSVIVVIIKTTDEFRNVGDAALGWDAYAMSHLSAEACTPRLAAGRGDGYQVTGISLLQQQLARSSVHIERPSTGRQV